MGPTLFCAMLPMVTWRWSKHHPHLPLPGAIRPFCQLMEHDLSQKLDFEAIAIVAS